MAKTKRLILLPEHQLTRTVNLINNEGNKITMQLDEESFAALCESFGLIAGPIETNEYEVTVYVKYRQLCFNCDFWDPVNKNVRTPELMVGFCNNPYAQALRDDTGERGYAYTVRWDYGQDCVRHRKGGN